MLSDAILLEALGEIAGANAHRRQGYGGQGSRSSVVRKWSEMLGVSVKTLYRRLKSVGLETGRKERRDKGKVKGATEEQLKTVAAIMMESWTEKYRAPIMPAYKAIELAERMGIIKPGELSPSVFNRWLRNHKISKRKLAERTPHQEMKSAYPNQVHEYDVSVCAQWYLKDDGSIGHQRRNFEVYKNKEGKPRQLKRHMLVDHFSGAFFPLYLLSENTRDSLEFLFCAWQKKRAELIGETIGEGMGPSAAPPGGGAMEGGLMERLGKVCDLFIFRGAPDILYTDQGTAVKGAIGQQVFERLGIEYIAHEKGNARATGAVEGNMWIWERAFESELKLLPAKNLLELNVRALEMALKYQVTKRHSRHGSMRLECWGKIGIENLRELPDSREVLRSLAMRASEKRSISYKGDIFWDGNVYKVPDQRLWGRKCLVGPDVFSIRGQTRGAVSDPDIMMIIVECDGKRFKLGSLAKDLGNFTSKATAWGEYKSPKNTETEKKVKEVAQDLSGYELQNIEVEGLKKFSSPRGTPVELEVEVAEKHYSRIGAKGEIMKRLGYAPLQWQMGIIKDFVTENTEITERRIQEIMEKLEGVDVDVG